MEWSVVQKLVISLALGLLVGFQREWSAPHVAGIRTFALVTLFGTVMGLLLSSLGEWIVIAGVLALTSMIVVVNVMKSAGRHEVHGLTTQVAALVMYAVGVTVAIDQFALAVLVGAGVAMLLHWKQPLHVFVQRIGDKDIRAIFQLVLIGLIVLPVLPNRAFGPYGVLNPYEIWLMVVLICGISVGSYLAQKFLGAKAGTVLSGIFGGMISSTATTVSNSRHAKRSPEASNLASLVIMIASTIVFARVILEIAVVAPETLRLLVPPIATLMLIMVVICGVLYFITRNKNREIPLPEDPADLKAAILFGILYAAVLFAVAIVKEHFGDRTLYGVAALSGLTDMDAITLSTARMIKADRLDVDTGWRMILVGGMSNLVFKGFAVAFLGSRQLLRRIAVLFGLSFLGGVLVLIFWP
ncbi:MgtC/SapB family protein [Roseiconus nitratireducens]|uniref:MgtC/SapB family protein n=1 Tax=Roseiconus nitratireducens TaxID=2605748 RepID=A0A5M6CZS4_9BACT|nr:MgtC/SapB family protein [Roseiconus nitratireducens]KAA5540737.1 MgtC/SapB family protein [Roseiconus nitratireducens]